MTTAASQPIRIGVIGCGNVLSAYKTPLDKLRIENKAIPLWACGREAQRAYANACLGDVRFTTTPQELLAAPEIDFVLILTSMPQHAELVRAALGAGKHVLVEKPLATNFKEAQELVELAKVSAGHLVAAPFTILSPTFQTMARRIRAGDIGQPALARARYGWAGPDWSEWFYKKGGGCVFDLGVYCITSLTGLLGPVQRVSAMTGTVQGVREINGKQIEVEAIDNAQITLDFGGSVFATVMSGFTMQQYRAPALEIYGTTGTIQMLGDDWDPDGYELWQNSAGAWQLFKETTPEWSWTAGLPHLVECILQNQKPLVTPEHALHVLEIMLKAEQASKEGRAIKLETSFELPAFAENKMHEPAHLMHDRSREHI